MFRKKVNYSSFTPLKINSTAKLLWATLDKQWKFKLRLMDSNCDEKDMNHLLPFQREMIQKYSQLSNEWPLQIVSEFKSGLRASDFNTAFSQPVVIQLCLGYNFEN